MRLRERYAAVDDWLRAHPAGWVAVAVIVTGLGFAGGRMLLVDEPFLVALLFGLLFGLTFAALTTFLR